MSSRRSYIAASSGATAMPGMSSGVSGMYGSQSSLASTGPSRSLTSSRISAIEITGSTRMNMKNRNRNSPIVPRNIDQSYTVGVYVSHELGRKSFDRLVTMIRNRSSHIPTFTHMEMANRAYTFRRTFFDQRNWIEVTLASISPQNTHQ